MIMVLYHDDVPVAHMRVVRSRTNQYRWTAGWYSGTPAFGGNHMLTGTVTGTSVLLAMRKAVCEWQRTVLRATQALMQPTRVEYA